VKVKQLEPDSKAQ